MSKIVLKIGLILSILSVIIILTGMSFNSSIENRSIHKLAPDTLKTINNYQVTLLKNETIDLNIGEGDYFYSTSSSDYKKGENQSISSDDYNFTFNYSELIKNDHLITPDELNLYNPKSTSKELKSLMNFSFSKYNLTNGFENISWWRYYDFNGGDEYQTMKDDKDHGIDVKMMDIFHDFMRNKVTREIIFQSIKQNFTFFNSQLTVFQKRFLKVEIDDLIEFCKNYNLNRKKYLKGRTSVTEKPGDYDFEADYGYETRNEGFLFRRIEFDGIPPLELEKFLIEFQKIIVNSFNSSDFNSNMSCEINGGKLKINSYANSKNTFGFLLRTSNNNGSYFVPSQNIKIIKLEINGKDVWKIIYDEKKLLYICLDENLKKV
jgi:hypothetical protein